MLPRIRQKIPRGRRARGPGRRRPARTGTTRRGVPCWACGLLSPSPLLAGSGIPRDLGAATDGNHSAMISPAPGRRGRNSPSHIAATLSISRGCCCCSTILCCCRDSITDAKLALVPLDRLSVSIARRECTATKNHPRRPKAIWSGFCRKPWAMDVMVAVIVERHHLGGCGVDVRALCLQITHKSRTNQVSKFHVENCVLHTYFEPLAGI